MGPNPAAGGRSENPLKMEFFIREMAIGQTFLGGGGGKTADKERSFWLLVGQAESIAFFWQTTAKRKEGGAASESEPHKRRQ